MRRSVGIEQRSSAILGCSTGSSSNSTHSRPPTRNNAKKRRKRSKARGDGGGSYEQIEAWGFDRSLWGTDWTRGVVNYEQAALPQTDRLNDSERAMLMGSACAKVYRWSPKNG